VSPDLNRTPAASGNIFRQFHIQCQSWNWNVVWAYIYTIRLSLTSFEDFSEFSDKVSNTACSLGILPLGLIQNSTLAPRVESRVFCTIQNCQTEPEVPYTYCSLIYSYTQNFKHKSRILENTQVSDITTDRRLWNRSLRSFQITESKWRHF
jgi:hypothetical protein